MTFHDEHAEALIGRLTAAGVGLTAAGGDVVYSGYAHALGDETIVALRDRKDGVLAILAHNAARGVVALAPTTWEQRRMEMRNRVDRNPATYNVCIRVDLRGRVAVGPLSRAVTALVRRHEALRTRFAWYGDHPLQEIIAPPRSVMQVMPPELLAGATDDEVAEWCVRRGAAPFDLAVDAPARWCYAPIGPRHAVLLVTMHHIVCDGWSIEILGKELNALYLAEAGEREAPELPPVTMTPSDFARWELAWLTAERAESARSFWAEELRGATLTPRLARATGRRGTGGPAGSVVRTIPSFAAAQVAALAGELSITEFAVYFAAFAMLLREETDGQACAVAVAVSNRTRHEHESVVGLCRNVLPVHAAAAAGETIDVVARRVSAHVLRAMEYQSYPISVVASQFRDVDGGADMNRLPLTFAFEPQDNLPMQCSSASVAVRDVVLGAAHAELGLLVRQREGRMEAYFVYSEDQLGAEDAAVLADRYVRTVAATEATRGH